MSIWVEPQIDIRFSLDLGIFHKNMIKICIQQQQGKNKGIKHALMCKYVRHFVGKKFRHTFELKKMLKKISLNSNFFLDSKKGISGKVKVDSPLTKTIS